MSLSTSLNVRRLWVSFARRPLTRITLRLVAVNLGLVLVAVFFGILPDPSNANLEARKGVVEALAVQVAALGKASKHSGHDVILERVVGRNPDVVSAGIRSMHEDLLAQAGDHDAHWVNVARGSSTSSHTQVPIYAGNQRWGTLEVQFEPMETLSGAWMPPWLIRLLAFLGTAGFISSYLLMNRTLSELDPTAVIPARVKTAMDAFSEGVILIDEQARAVMVNCALCERLGYDEDAFLDRPLLSSRCIDPTTGKAPAELPWQVALASAEARTGSVLSVATRNGKMCTFVCNCSPITDGDGRSRGALVTFDDVTDFEARLTEVQRQLEGLRELLRHEIRSPVAEIETSLSALAESTEGDDTATALASAKTSVNHLQDLLDQIDRGSSIGATARNRG